MVVGGNILKIIENISNDVKTFLTVVTDHFYIVSWLFSCRL